MPDEEINFYETVADKELIKREKIRLRKQGYSEKDLEEITKLAFKAANLADKITWFRRKIREYRLMERDARNSKKTREVIRLQDMINNLYENIDKYENEYETIQEKIHKIDERHEFKQKPLPEIKERQREKTRELETKRDSKEISEDEFNEKLKRLKEFYDEIYEERLNKHIKDAEKASKDSINEIRKEHKKHSKKIEDEINNLINKENEARKKFYEDVKRFDDLKSKELSSSPIWNAKKTIEEPKLKKEIENSRKEWQEKNKDLEERKKQLEEHEKQIRRDENNIRKKRPDPLPKYFSSHMGKVAGTVLLMVIGMALSAILGGVFFFLAFLSWAVFYVIPHPRGDFSPVEKKLKEIEKKLAKGEIEPERAEAMSKTEIAIAEVINDGWFKGLKGQGKMLGKYIFKMGGFIFLTLAFALAPLLKPIAIIVALVAYFMVE